jgi:plasmid stabilization system protein ParE
LAFQVDIAEPALADAEDYFRFIRDAKKEPEAAERRFRGLVQAIYSLEELPDGATGCSRQKSGRHGGRQRFRADVDRRNQARLSGVILPDLSHC